jgi:hypothetical protein
VTDLLQRNNMPMTQNRKCFSRKFAASEFKSRNIAPDVGA